MKQTRMLTEKFFLGLVQDKPNMLCKKFFNLFYEEEAFHTVL